MQILEPSYITGRNRNQYSYYESLSFLKRFYIELAYDLAFHTYTAKEKLVPKYT